MKIFVVGGAVRDVLLGERPKDLDYVVVGATEQDMLNQGFSKVGADFPVFLDSTGQEHALARTERKVAAGYNGFEVNFDLSVTLEQDLVRRDLTINAMAVRADDWDRFVITRDWGLVIDPFSGRHDLGNRTLRHVSNAFSEDPVRVLRVARFAARYDFKINVETQNLMCALTQSGELDHLVPERVWAEMEKAIDEPHPANFFTPLSDIGALNILMPELRFDTRTVANLTLASLLPRNSIFAALFVNSSVSDIEAMCDRLKATNRARKLSVRTRLLFELAHADLTPERVVSTFERMKATQDGGVRTTNDALDVCSVVCVLDDSVRERLGTLRSLHLSIRDVGFMSLTKKQRSTLKGAAIGNALRDIRVNIVNEQLRRSNS